VTQFAVTVRDLEAEDLSDLDWSGGSEHVHAVAEALTAAYADEMVLLVVALPNGRLVGSGAADLRRFDDAGLLMMLSVHETFQGMGIGTLLVTELEQRLRARGLSTARIGVEHDNPRAAALYRRLGYREVGATVESWPVSGARTYVTVTAVLERDLAAPRAVDSLP
jgi:ribosomal protein S18 acetylase RimI-like enzyme